MKRFLFFHYMSSLCYSKSLSIFHPLFFTIIFFTNTAVKSQQQSFPEQNSSATLVLTNGAEIYSTDNIFNKQILTKKIVIQNSKISFQRNKDNETLLKAIIQSSKEKNTNLKNQLKNVENKKQKEDLNKVEKEIEKHKVRTKDYRYFSFNYFPSQNQYFSSHTIEKNYITPVQNNKKNYKSYIPDIANLISSMLYFLNSEVCTYYNNKSLQHSFSEAFSVRPPPTFKL